MKMMSVRADFSGVDHAIQALTDQGATIFKIVDRTEVLPGMGVQPTHSQIIFYFPDSENATMFKLKQPSGSFAEH
jgi:hypothetical protein